MKRTSKGYDHAIPEEIVRAVTIDANALLVCATAHVIDIGQSC